MKLIGEYEGKQEIIEINNLKEIKDLSGSRLDFLQKVTYMITDETSILIPENQIILEHFYHNN